MSEVDDNSIDAGSRRTRRKAAKTERGNAYELDILTRRAKKLSEQVCRTVDSLEIATAAGAEETLSSKLKALDGFANEAGNIRGRLPLLSSATELATVHSAAGTPPPMSK